VATALVSELGDPEDASNTGALIAFFMMVLMAKGFIIATPFIVRATSGNIMMPALSAGFAGAYGFGRALGESQHACNRYPIGGASGVEYAALRVSQLFGVQHMPHRRCMNQSVPAARHRRRRTRRQAPSDSRPLSPGNQAPQQAILAPIRQYMPVLPMMACYPAQQLSFATSLSKVCAASFSPSTVVR